MAAIRLASQNQPCRSARYFPATTEASATISSNLQQKKQFGSAQNPCVPSDCAQTHIGAHCPSDQVNTDVHFPFRKVLVASKLLLLPEKGTSDSIFKANTCNGLRNSTAIPESIQRETSNGAPQARVLLATSHEPKRPVTPPFGRNARINEFIQSRLQSGGAKGLPSQSRCPPGDDTQGHPTYQEIEQEVTNWQESINKYITPMSHFKVDQRIVDKTLRNYKRDQELQKESCQYLEVNMFPDVCDRNWYNYMMSSPNPTPMDWKTEKGSYIVRADDILPGGGYLKPGTAEGGYEREDMTKNRPHSFRKSRTAFVSETDRLASEDADSLKCAVDENLHAIREEINQRDRLLETLAASDKFIHAARGQFCDVQGNDQETSHLIKQIRAAEGQKRYIEDSLRSKEGSLDELMRHQHYLESKLIHMEYA